MGRSSTSYTGPNKTSFKPGNQMFDREKLGAPEYWTEERIDDLITNLGEWVQKDESISMAGWRGYNTITRSSLDHIRLKSPVFARAYECAREIIAGRLAEKTGNGVHSSVFNMLTPVYDSEVRAYEAEKSSRDSDNRKQELGASIDNMTKFNNQISARRIAESNINPEQKS